MRCVRFWHKMMTHPDYENHIIRRAAMEALTLNAGCWVAKLQECFKAFGWNSSLVNCQGLKNISGYQLRGMLRSIVEKVVSTGWLRESSGKSKLNLLHKIFDLGLSQRCWIVRDRAMRSMLVKLRGGTAHFEIETGRWRGLEREERVCRECSNGTIEDTCHWMMTCPTWGNLRQPLIERVRQVIDDFEEMETESKTVSILDNACKDLKTAKLLYVMWCERFER